MNGRNKIKYKMAFFPVAIIAITLVLGLIIMFLWNAVVSPVLQLQKVNFWQAVGLFILSRILFGGFRGGGFQGRGGWRGGPQWRQKWMNMSEEDRAKFREEWQRRCGHRNRKQE